MKIWLFKQIGKWHWWHHTVGYFIFYALNHIKIKSEWKKFKNLNFKISNKNAKYGIKVNKLASFHLAYFLLKSQKEANKKYINVRN